MFTKHNLLAIGFASIIVFGAWLVLLSPFKKTSNHTDLDNDAIFLHDRKLIEQLQCYTTQSDKVRIGGKFIYLCMLEEKIRLAKKLDHYELLKNAIGSGRPQEYAIISVYYFPEFYYQNLPKELKLKFYNLIDEFNNRPSAHNGNPVQSKDLPRSYIYIWNYGDVSEYARSSSVGTVLDSFRLPKPNEQ